MNGDLQGSVELVSTFTRSTFHRCIFRSIRTPRSGIDFSVHVQVDLFRGQIVVVAKYDLLRGFHRVLCNVFMAVNRMGRTDKASDLLASSRLG
jgi:hypothetical protein